MIAYIKKHWYEISIILAVLFFLILIIFNKPINNWLKDKKEFRPNLYSRWTEKTYLPKSNEGKYEARCREIIQKLLKRPFPKKRPDFLKRSNGYRLELDGLNMDLKLAFEYNGIQHEKYSTMYHKSYQDFIDQKQRDREKRLMCAAKGVKLIEIPHTIKYDKLESHIKKELDRLGVSY
jgi:hypothetical protein